MKIYPLFLLILLFSCSWKKATPLADIDNSLKSSGLKGKVRQVTIKRYKHYNAGVTQLQKVLIRETTNKYNEDGYLLESDITDISGSDPAKDQVSKQVYKYDSKYNQVECTLYDSDGKITQKATTKFNDKNKPLESTTTISFRGMNSVVRMEYFYDSNDNNTKMKISSEDSNVVSSTITLKYNEKGLCTERIVIAQNGHIESKQVCKYDGSGRKIEMSEYNKEGTLGIRSENKYDDNGLVLEHVFSYANGNTTEKQSNKYDDFDKQGNWLKLTSINNYGLKSTSERTIEYY